MRHEVARLIAALAEKKEVLREMRELLKKEQALLSVLDLPGMEQSQQDLEAVIGKLERLSGASRDGIAAVAAVLKVPAPASLTPLIELLANPERGALKRAQDEVLAESRLMGAALELHRTLLADSLGVVRHSVAFFNRLFNPVDTYGQGGTMVSRRGGSRFVCKEI